jgi:hypothetical protein
MEKVKIEEGMHEIKSINQRCNLLTIEFTEETDLSNPIY